MPTKEAKRLIKFLESTGYEFVRKNTKGFAMYELEGFPVVGINQSINDVQAGNVIRSLQKLHGIERDADRAKRSAGNAKKRHAEERERAKREAERSRARLAELRAEREERMREAGERRRIRNAQLDGLGAHLTNDEVERVTEAIEAEEAELRRWQRLMTQVPSNNAHAGRESARHRS